MREIEILPGITYTLPDAPSVPSAGAAGFDFEVVVPDALGAIQRQLKELGDKDLRKELARGIQRAAKPLRSAAQSAARENLPRKGGLNEWVASSKFSVSTQSGKYPAVRISGRKSGHDLRALDRGRIRHPLYGNRKHWFTQQIRPGWFSDAMVKEVPAVRGEIVRVLEDIAEKLVR